MKLNNNDDSHNSGLNLLIYNMLLDIESHPAWVCGLKLRTGSHPQSALSHTLRGCVDWNFMPDYLNDLKFNQVTPCVGVWIETENQQKPYTTLWVTPCVGVWIETENILYDFLLS